MRAARPLVWLLCFGLATAAGQDPKAPTKPADKPQPKKEKAADQVPGYKTVKVQGFTFLVSQEVFAEDVSKYERKPLEVLDLECKTLVKILSPKAVDLLRRLTVWVEWDERVGGQNGRAGRVLASYTRVTPAEMVEDGKHPLRGKTVTIHTLKLLTESRQPKDDVGECLLLHEFAHAVHDQLLTYDHPGIKAAYQQGMERKLYDKDLYVATNHMEFFAEITCAYLDHLRYYPHNRADLKKHDPTTFKLMETVWAGAVAKTTEVAKPQTGPVDGSDKFDLDVTLPGGIKFGPAAAGTAPTPGALAGKVVLVGYWGGEFSNVLNRLDRLNEDLGPYGLVVIAPHAYVMPVDEVKADAAKRADGFAVLEKAFVLEKDGTTLTGQPGGHVLLFDHTGKCVFRGRAYDVDKPTRAAVGQMLLATAAGGSPLPARLKPVADALAGGPELVTLLPKLSGLSGVTEDDVKTVATKLTDLILAPGRAVLADARTTAKTDPVAAYLAIEGVAARFKNTLLAPKAQAMLGTLRTEKAVETELKARPLLAQVQKMEAFLRGQAGSFDPTSPAFQRRNGDTIAQMQAAVEQLRKQYPTTRAAERAAKIAREFGPP